MKKLLVGLILLLSLSMVMSATQTTLDTDTFGGTAGTVLHTYNANWINSTLSNLWNDCVISTPNGAATGSIFSGAYRIGQTWTDNHFSQATIGALSLTRMALYVRLTGDGSNNPSTGYNVGTNPNATGNNLYRLSKLSTLVAVSATVAQAGDVVNIQVIGTTITVMVNGVALSDLTTTDSDYTTGNPGLYVEDAVGKWTNWSAGSATNGSGGTHNLLTLGVGD